MDQQYADRRRRTIQRLSQSGGPRTGLLLSTDGRNTWRAIDGSGRLTGSNISGVAARGSTILEAIRADLEEFQRFIRATPDLLAEIPHGKGKTYLRSVLLAADHTSYHVGQLVSARQLLGAWPLR